MEKSWVRGWLLFQNIHSPLANPAPDLPGQQQHEHRQEPAPDVLSEARHRQQRIEYGIPGFFAKVFDFDRAERSIEQPLERKHKSAGADEEEVGKDQEASVRLREVDRGAVEVRPLVEGLEEACRRRRGGGTGVVCEAHDAGGLPSQDEVSKWVGQVGRDVHGPTISEEVELVAGLVLA